MTGLTRRLLGVSLISGLLILDQLTKYWVLTTEDFNALGCLHDRFRCGRIELSSVMDLSMVWNRGMSFGTLQSEGIMRWVLVVLTISIAIGFAVWLFRAERRLTFAALSLVVAGAIGNVIDRIRFGAVVDFFDFSGPWFGWTIGNFAVGFPWVFNVADACITIGAMLLFLDQFLLSRETVKHDNKDMV